MSYIWSLIGFLFSVSQDVFAGEEQLGTATAVIEEASPCQLLFMIFTEFPKWNNVIIKT